jgi:hypothetical protein
LKASPKMVPTSRQSFLPSFGTRMSIVFRNTSNSKSQSTSAFSWVITYETLTQKRKSSAVWADQLLTVRAAGHRQKVESIPTVANYME